MVEEEEEEVRERSIVQKKKKMSSNIHARAKPVRVHTQSQREKKIDFF
jgi:hypothetical protein